MTQTINPFEHHHHHHDDEPPVRYEEMDPAQRSLADALRVTFFILKIVMIGLVVWYLFSGWYIVKSGEVAVQLRFGKPVSDQPTEPGRLNFAFPYPIDRVIKVDTNVQVFQLQSQFWSAKSGQSAGTELNPQQGDGFMLTGDANMVHARWQVEYRVSDANNYVRNLANPDIAEKKKMMADAEAIIRAVAEEAVIYAVAQVKADDLIKGQLKVAYGVAQRRAQEVLTRMEAGVTIRSISAYEKRIPEHVRPDYEAVIKNENERSQRVLEAQQERIRILSEMAGDAHEPLWELVRAYELATETNDQDQINRLEASFDQAFSTMRIKDKQGNEVAITGDVSRTISEARAFYAEVTNTALREASTFRDLKKSYDENPRIVMNRLWQDVHKRIMANPNARIFMTPKGEFRLHLNPDPGQRRKMEQERNKQIELEAKSPEERKRIEEEQRRRDRAKTEGDGG